MAVHYFIDKPQPIPSVLWDGTNWAEVDAWQQANGFPDTYSDNEDGTLMLSWGSTPIPTDSWLYPNWNGIMDTNGKQEVPGPDVDYTVS